MGWGFTGSQFLEGIVGKEGVTPMLQCTPSSIKIIKFRLPETTTTRSAKREGKQIGDIKMDVGRMSANKNGAKKPFVTNASDNHTNRPM